MFTKHVEARNTACPYASPSNVLLSKATSARVASSCSFALRPICRGSPAGFGLKPVSSSGLCCSFISVAPPCSTLAKDIVPVWSLKRALVLVGFAFRSPRRQHLRPCSTALSTSRSRNLEVHNGRSRDRDCFTLQGCSITTSTS